jgi:hypothetical protein
MAERPPARPRTARDARLRGRDGGVRQELAEEAGMIEVARARITDAGRRCSRGQSNGGANTQWPATMPYTGRATADGCIGAGSGISRGEPCEPHQTP